MWRNGGLPVWQDGWGREPGESLTEAKVKKVEIPSSLEIFTPGPFTLNFKFPTISNGIIFLEYRFTNTFPEHRAKIPALINRLIATKPLELAVKFDNYLEFDYSFHAQIPNETGMVFEIFRSVEVRPRKKRKPRPLEFKL